MELNFTKVKVSGLVKREREASRQAPRPSPCLLLHWHLCGEVHGVTPTAVRGWLWQQLLIPLEIKRERTLYTEKGNWENQEIKRQCIWKETRLCNKVGWLKLCSDCAFAASEGPTVLRMEWEQGPPEAHGVSMSEWSLASRAVQVRAAAQSTRAARGVLLLLLLLLQGQAGTAVISYLVKKRCFARTSYFQQSTQDCFAVAVCGYSCISSLLLMETELQCCFPHGKGQHAGQTSCHFTSS